jgi:DNA-binding transcriptional ArsR family regulator
MTWLVERVTAVWRRCFGRDMSSAELLAHSLAKALAHDVRIEILAIASRRPISPIECAVEIGVPLVRVSYHFRELRNFGMIELVTPDRAGALVRADHRATPDVVPIGLALDEALGSGGPR